MAATARVSRSSQLPKLPILGMGGVTKEVVTERTAQIILGLFPDMASGARASHKYFAKFLTAVGLIGILALLGVNTLLAQDAFTLSKLKLEAKAVADERDAVNREIDRHASPENLAAAATALGMKSSDTPIFLDLSQQSAAESGAVTRG
jgi:hypothetical protein